MPDQYDSFEQLARNESEGADYRIRLESRSSSVAVIAPHGGWIEPGTSEIAQAIAGDDYSFYAFEGLRPNRPHGDLHITSTRFDEPHALALVASADIAISVHGLAEPNGAVLVGGLDIALRDAIGRALQQAGFEAHTQNHAFLATDGRNICNRTARGNGVQLEIPRQLRDHLRADQSRLDSFAGAVRHAMFGLLS